MGIKWLFLRWALLASLIFAGNLIVIVLGWFEEIYYLDQTWISYSIIGLFWVMTVYCGFLTWKANNVFEYLNSGGELAKRNRLLFEKIEHQTNHGWYAASVCEKLGLLGTVWGFLLMLLGTGGFSGLEKVDPQKVKELIEQLGAGLSTAFLTTLVGIICSILLSLQYHNLCHFIEEAKIEKR